MCSEKTSSLIGRRSKEKTLLIDMACPNESNKDFKRVKRIKKYQKLCFELREQRGYMVTVIPTVIGYLGGRLKELKTNLKRISEVKSDNDPKVIAREMQKTVLWESESLIGNILSGLLT